SGSVGQEVTIKGTGFGSSQNVRIDFGTHQTITTTSATENGTFSATFIADNQSQGTKTITALGFFGQQFDTTCFNLTEGMNPQITQITPIEGVVGTVVTVQGSGFAGNSQISIDFGTHQTITITTSSANGTFSTTFIANTQGYGTKAVTARDSQGNIANTFFKITSKIVLVKPASGQVGSVVTIEGVGFGPNQINIDFGTHLSIAQVLGSWNGTFSATFIVTTQSSGIKLITAKGPSHDIATIIFYLISPPPSPTITLIPNQGYVGSMVTVTGVNFAQTSTITIHFGTHPSITTATSSSNGTFSLTFIVNTQPVCTKLITARDGQGNIATAHFKLTSMITFLSPTSGSVGAIVTIQGTGFNGWDTSTTISFG
ncbi:MAG: IPT/TIG domain-containing protein, partial [bacterium]|nr:IPT/TIG domain-containing protein [bacterium]